MQVEHLKLFVLEEEYLFFFLFFVLGFRERMSRDDLEMKIKESISQVLQLKKFSK